MGATTGIQWCDATWNPWIGCHKVSQGCLRCYMFRNLRQYKHDPTIVVRSKTTFGDPLRWAKTSKVGSGSRIFTCSWSDWFISEADEWRDEAWSIIRQTPQFNYLILTKRPERMKQCLPADWGMGYENVWLGVSVERQTEADARIPILMNTPAKIRFVSAEPLLAPIDFWKFSRHEGGFGPDIDYRGTYAFAVIAGFPAGPQEMAPGLSWIITGGESDSKAPRPCDLEWLRSIRDQCQDAGVAFFHKQNGGSRKVDGAWGGRVLDGRTWDEFPK